MNCSKRKGHLQGTCRLPKQRCPQAESAAESLSCSIASISLRMAVAAKAEVPTDTVKLSQDSAAVVPARVSLPVSLAPLLL